MKYHNVTSSTNVWTVWIIIDQIFEPVEAWDDWTGHCIFLQYKPPFFMSPYIKNRCLQHNIIASF